MEKIISPCAMILDENSFSGLLINNTVLFFGNGSDKLKRLINHHNAFFDDIQLNSSLLIKISNKRFQIQISIVLHIQNPYILKIFMLLLNNR